MSDERIEIITGRERRRRWSIEEKLRIVAATYEPGARVKHVAASHDICSARLRAWPHDPSFQRRRERVPRSRSHDRAQFALKLEGPHRALPVITGNPAGLLDALADLLLAALGVEATMTKGADNERQDHA